MSNYSNINVMIKDGVSIVNVNELADCLKIETQSGRDLLRHGITSDNIVKIPISKSQNAYYLNRQGVEEFVKKYKPELYDEIMLWLSDIENKTVTHSVCSKEDSYSADLLEDILATLKRIQHKQLQMEDLFLDVMSKVMITTIELEAMTSSGFSVLAKAEAEGYLARTNKKRAHDLQIFAKEFSANTEHYQKMLNELIDMLWGDEDKTKEQTVTQFKTVIGEIVKQKENKV